MRGVAVVAFGGATVLRLVRSARRNAVRDRLRRTRTRAWVPARVERLLGRALDDAALTVPADHALSIWALAVVVAAMLGASLGGALAAVLAASLATVAPAVVLHSMRGRREQRVTAAVPAALERVSSELRAGGTISTALAAIAAGDGVLAADFARIQTRRALGAPTADVLRAWSRERRAHGVDAAAGALALCATVGGRSADALDGLASSLRDRLDVLAESRALSAQARMSAIVVGGAPIAYLVWSAVVDPHGVHALLATPSGHACLAAGLLFEGLGLAWMRRIVRTAALR